MKNSEIIKNFIDSNEEIINTHINNLPTLLHLMIQGLRLYELDSKLSDIVDKSYEENKTSSQEIHVSRLKTAINSLFVEL